MKYKKLCVIPVLPLGDLIDMVYSQVYPDTPYTSIIGNMIVNDVKDILKYYFGISESLPKHIEITPTIMEVIIDIDSIITGYIGEIWDILIKVDIPPNRKILYLFFI